MPTPPSFIESLVPYQAGKPIEELAREKGLTKISKLASNENPMGASPNSLEIIHKNYSEIHRYPDMNGFNLKKEIADFHGISMDRVVLGSGSEGVMTYIAKAFLSVGDEVVTSANSFIGFYIIAKASGANLILIGPTKDQRFDMDRLTNEIGPKTKLVYLANPNNPTGTMITKKEFEQLLEKLPPTTLLIVDEAYVEYAEKEKEYPNSLNYNLDNLITLRTFSKAYGLAGLRVGYGISTKEIVTTLSKVKPPFEPNLLGQMAACEAIKDQNFIKRVLKENKAQYEKLFTYLTDKGLAPIPSFTNFVTLPTKSKVNSDWLFSNLLNEGVIIRKLDANRMSDFVRISIGLESEMNHFYEAFNKLYPQFETMLKGS
ncbi:histidinol-phosphate transaminase [Bacteriovoracales bacterium]|nr:histidinol-phosphate transaminase [Bacteriovoracales bacterium]